MIHAIDHLDFLRSRLLRECKTILSELPEMPQDRRDTIDDTLGAFDRGRSTVTVLGALCAIRNHWLRRCSTAQRRELANQDIAELSECPVCGDEGRYDPILGHSFCHPFGDYPDER